MESGIEIKTKRCSRKTCMKEYPATLEFFTVNNKAADKFSYYCKPCQAEIAKEIYNKKHGKSSPVELRPAPVPVLVVASPTPVPNPVPIEPQLYVCHACKEPFELSDKNFWKNRGNITGYETVCIECSKKKKRERRRIAAGTHPENCILLKFDDSPELFEKVREWAKQNRRDPDQQIIFALEQEILKVG